MRRLLPQPKIGVHTHQDDPAGGTLAHNTATSNPASAHGVSGNVVGTTDAQTLASKTLVSPTLTGEAQAEVIGFAELDNGNSGATATIDWSARQKQRITLTANCTLSFTDPANPCNLLLVVVQDGTGSRTVTWPASVLWPGGTAPTLSTAGGAIDIISFYWDGTNYYGADSLNFS